MKLKIFFAACIMLLFSVSSLSAQNHSGGKHKTGTGHIKGNKKADPDKKAKKKNKQHGENKGVSRAPARRRPA